MKKSPLVQVKERFGSKDQLVEAVENLATDELWIDRYNETKGLESVSNAKLLRLHAVLSEAREKFGSRDRLVAAILQLEKRSKDTGLEKRLQSFPVPRLMDLHRAAARRAKARAAAAPPARPKKVARSRKAQAKARAASG